MSSNAIWEAAGNDLWFEDRGELNRVVAIEYHNRHPFNVLTEIHWDHSTKPWFNPEKHRPTGTSPHHWNFEWCRREKVSYYNMSGCGGNVKHIVAPYCDPSKVRCLLWVAEGIPIVRQTGRGKEIRVSDDGLLKMGYRRLRRPMLLTRSWNGHKSRNPFEVAEEGSCTYCKICRDWLPNESWSGPCEHIEWCDECAAWIYAESREHVDDDRSKCAHTNSED